MKFVAFCRNSHIIRNAEPVTPTPTNPAAAPTRTVTDTVTLSLNPSPAQAGIQSANINLQLNAETTVGQFQDGKKYNVTIEEAV